VYVCADDHRSSDIVYGGEWDLEMDSQENALILKGSLYMASKSFYTQSCAFC